MTRPIRLAISGASGRMGRALLDLAREDGRFELVAAIVSPHSAWLGKSAYGDVSAWKFTDWRGAEDIDVVIDFSGLDGLMLALDHCEGSGAALVTGTTGLSAELEQRLARAAERIPVLRAANFSLGVAVLTRLLRDAAAALPGWDLDIVEAHHHRKEDAPSGTALAMGRAAADARGATLEDLAVYTREGRPGARKAGTIGFAVVRGGDIVGEHQALLMGQGERIELGHRATDRSIFARGAIEAAAWIAGRAPGTWTIEDVIVP
ncbi:4-hydroxy-tetrahydrodipicolinate reductase [Luteibacter sp. PPL201]|jgi:4-hydroxy-tetrahydrodipicolinate reductase|uniref:4-hydroxy-tetrahydrodipicolinate reductase n=1 Tax=Luteibacter sahnii TaxID=3021977 RepID=A0ABT6BCK5_9GAMM|nr:4-hydroxy-tetrahydrodipicolinate reductase [Luteibacter sp. PPL193]MDY1550243.1 4-hydroxy-tetrahydrodipicolinate reductase [Luteibacter sp. PPL193]